MFLFTYFFTYSTRHKYLPFQFLHTYTVAVVINRSVHSLKRSTNSTFSLQNKITKYRCLVYRTTLIFISIYIFYFLHRSLSSASNNRSVDTKKSTAIHSITQTHAHTSVQTSILYVTDGCTSSINKFTLCPKYIFIAW